jgi:hypothetical protein
MSSWKLAARVLYRMGGTATVERIMDEEPDLDSGRLCSLRLYGLATSNGRIGGNQPATYTLTQLGIDWCEGRVREVPAPRTPGIHGRRMRFVATWLASLPRGIRITQPEPAPCTP